MKLDPSLKKLIGLLVFLPAFLLYIGLVVTVSDYLPQHWAILGIYFVIAGTVWAFPLKPLMLWMNKPASSYDE
ncbi:MAG: DUF2842 domain-containing protein [Aquisalinus sp.]|nr:DUF2842 domain-containing protein [Aquisalinus sp.]